VLLEWNQYSWTLSFGEIENQITDIIKHYNQTNLNVFDNFYSDVILLNQIKETNRAIVSCFSRKVINKNQEIIYAAEIENVLFIGNALKQGIQSSKFLYGNVECVLKDDKDGMIYIYKTSDNTKFLINSFGRVDYESGIIYYFFPKFGRLIENNFGTTGIINFRMIPIDPDIETFYQNIVRITTTRVVLTNA
jgi:hypothetical protein